MSMGDNILLSVVGMGVVFVALFVISLLIRAMSAFFMSMEKRKAQNAVAGTALGTSGVAVGTTNGASGTIGGAGVSSNAQVSVDAHAKLSCGDVNLHSVDEPTAAILMAIVAGEAKIPLNEMRFVSVREV